MTSQKSLRLSCQAHPEDRFDWPDGTSADRSDVERGDYDFMSDDFTVVPFDQRMDHLEPIEAPTSPENP